MISARPRHPRSIDTQRRSAGSVSDLRLDQEANWSMPRFLTLPVLRRRSKAERR